MGSSLPPFRTGIKIPEAVANFVKYFHVRDLHLRPLFSEAPGAGKEDGLFPTESTPPNNDLEGPESGLNDYQTLDEATSTFKPDHGLAGYGEAQMMLNPLYEDGRST